MKSAKISLKQIIRIAAIIIVVMACVYVLFGPEDTPADTSVQEQFSVISPGDELQSDSTNEQNQQTQKANAFNLSDVPEYTGVKSFTVNGGNPYFTDDEISYSKDTGSFEFYGELDSLGRCTAAVDNLSLETMPAKGEKRESIRDIKPSGWKQAFYDCVDNESVMTRTHLVGWMLSAENANERNLISGTRYMNSDAMTTLELATARYIEKNAARHVLYRVTPIYEGNNLMASGVLMEGLSLDDGGNSIRFCEYLYNVQPGLLFDYSTGKSKYSGIFFDTNSESVKVDGMELQQFIMDGKTIHNADCTKTDSKTCFEGDVTMISYWPSMGYSLCQCIN